MEMVAILGSLGFDCGMRKVKNFVLHGSNNLAITNTYFKK